MEISFHGGVDTVTGSCHLLKAGGMEILVDCGLFQGDPSWEEKNRDSFSFDPSRIDFLLLTHGHLDHCGRIPLLVKKGFRGSILCTSATYDIAKIVLMDSARIHEEDFDEWKKISLRKGERPKEPLYTTVDVLDSLRLFRDFADYDRPVRLNDKVVVTFRDAGHILGAAFLEVAVKGKKHVLFSGDLGNRQKPIIRDPALPGEADVIVVETTYAGRNHRSFSDSVDELAQVIRDACKRGGNVLIPSFAIERAQDLLFVIRKLSDEEKIPPCRVFLDSPMGINVTEVMRRHPECFDQETLALFKNNEDPFSFPGLEFTKTPEESRQINHVKSHAIIIAGSGMCTGGRIKHHLKHNIWREESSIVFVGFQAEGTLGRKIVDREKTVRIFGELYRLNAQVHTIGGFSSHADKGILLDWLGQSPGAEKIFLVHGEGKETEGFRAELERLQIGKSVHIPHLGEVHQL